MIDQQFTDTWNNIQELVSDYGGDGAELKDWMTAAVFCIWSGNRLYSPAYAEAAENFKNVDYFSGIMSGLEGARLRKGRDRGCDPCS